MSTATLLYLLGIQNVEYHSTEYEDGKIIFHAESSGNHPSCPKCGGSMYVSEDENVENYAWFLGEKCHVFYI